ncbi:MAG: hypothetical protein ABUS51_10835 [Acidobacteriota bacterium]
MSLPGYFSRGNSARELTLVDREERVGKAAAHVLDLLRDDAAREARRTGGVRCCYESVVSYDPVLRAHCRL